MKPNEPFFVFIFGRKRWPHIHVEELLGGPTLLPELLPLQLSVLRSARLLPPAGLERRDSTQMRLPAWPLSSVNTD